MLTDSSWYSAGYWHCIDCRRGDEADIADDGDGFAFRNNTTWPSFAVAVVWLLMARSNKKRDKKETSVNKAKTSIS